MPSVVEPPKTLYDRVFGDHVVNEQNDGTVLIDLAASFAGKVYAVRVPR